MTGDTQSPGLFEMSQISMPQGAPMGNPSQLPFTGSADDAPAVMAYRMGQVETKVDALLHRFDQVATHYVTTATLMMTLEPVKERVKGLEDNEKEREKRKASENSQFRLAIAVAILSPVMSIIISVLIGNK